MTRLTVQTKGSEATKALGRAIGERLTGGEVILLSGPLGAGKTTLTQGIASGLGVDSRVQSPSFVLERIHRGRLLLRHLDFYRLDAAAVDESGLLSEFDDAQVVVIEWAERAEGVTEGTIRITIGHVQGEADARHITIEAPSNEWGERILDAARKLGHEE